MKKSLRFALCAALSLCAPSLAPSPCAAQTSASAAPREDGALVQGAGPAVYVIINGQRRWVRSEQAFNAMGFAWSAIVRLPDAALNAIPEGTPVAAFADLYPEGTLLKSADRPHVYILHGGRRQHIANEATFNALHLDWGRVRTIPETLLQRIPEGAPIAIEAAAPAPSGDASGGVFRPGQTPRSRGVTGAHGATMWAVTLAATAGPSPAFSAYARQVRSAQVIATEGDLSCTPPVGGAYPRAVPPGASTLVLTALFGSRDDARQFASALARPALRVGQVRTMCSD